MKSDQELFLRTPVRKAVMRMAIPTVISSLVLVIYNMADTFFVGQTHDACQVAAVSLTNAVLVMYMAVANLIGIGGSATISILLGQVFGLKGINFTQTTADYLSIVIALFLLVRALRRQHPATDSEQGRGRAIPFQARACYNNHVCTKKKTPAAGCVRRHTEPGGAIRNGENKICYTVS